MCRGMWMEVYAFGNDAFYPKRNVVRFTKKVDRNINKQNFDIVRWPILQGNIKSLKKTDLKLQEPVSISLSKINLDNIGTLNITFMNMCFNSLGFLTHDTHILI